MEKNQQTFINPVLDKNVADPTILKGDDGYYYLFYTGPFTSTFYRSKDWINWEDTGICPFNHSTIIRLKSIAKDYDSDPVIYAPTLIKNEDRDKDQYMLFISISWKALTVLVSDTVTGPYHFEDDVYNILVDKEISGLDITFEDSCVAKEVTGKNKSAWYLMFGSHGRMYRTRLTQDGTSLYNYKFEHVAGCKFWARNVFEGLYAKYHDGYWYLFAAKGNYTSATDPYEVTVARAKTLDGVFRNKYGLRMDWGFGSVILKPNSTLTYLGGGHTGEIFTDNNGNDYIFYQRQRANEMHFRPLFLQRIYWGNDGWPYFKDNVTQIEEIIPSL